MHGNKYRRKNRRKRGDPGNRQRAEALILQGRWSAERLIRPRAGDGNGQ